MGGEGKELDGRSGRRQEMRRVKAWLWIAKDSFTDGLEIGVMERLKRESLAFAMGTDSDAVAYEFGQCSG